MNNPDEAYSYYQKALESLDDNTTNETRAELYFKYALANDDRQDEKNAFEYYAKCWRIITLFSGYFANSVSSQASTSSL